MIPFNVVLLIFVIVQNHMNLPLSQSGNGNDHPPNPCLNVWGSQVNFLFELTKKNQNMCATKFQAKHATCQLCVSPGHLDVYLHCLCLLHPA